MLMVLEKYWFIISFLLLFVLFAAFLLWPTVSAALIMPILVLGLGIAILFIIRRQLQSHRAGEINRAGLIRNIVVETIGLLLTMALAALVVRSMIEMINLSSVSWIGIGTAIALSVLIGLVVGWLVKVTWGRWTKAQ